MSRATIESILTEKTLEAMQKLYGQAFSSGQVTLQKTRPEFEGDLTLLVFPLTKASKKSPEETANAIGNYLKENVTEVTAFNVVKGFLNLVITDSYWTGYLLATDSSSLVARSSSIQETVMVEFSSPNTNKPLHLGHIRNNLLGASVAEILKAAGKKVIRVNLVNDRGIHICKSMQAWIGYAKGESPETTSNPKHKKGDHLVGYYYVKFDEIYKDQIKQSENLATDIIKGLIKQQNVVGKSGMDINANIGVLVHVFQYVLLFAWKKENQINFDLPPFSEFIYAAPKLLGQLSEGHTVFMDQYVKDLTSVISKLSFDRADSLEFKEHLLKIAKDYVPLVYSAHHLLRLWEAGDKETIDLWKKMNGWVYDGFAKTYKELGIEFEKTYYESDTYLLGKKIVEEGLHKGVFKNREDGSVWIDLTAEGLDEKLVLRADGTSVYITQDLGTVMQRLQDFKEAHINKLIYVVGNEQDYHFKVLFLIIKKLVEQNVAGFGSLSLGESGERGVGASLFHLSYGMVDLPSGKMKSREGTVVDADELMDEMISSARETTKALGKTEGMNESEAEALYHNIGLGALKYFILKVDPKKRMLFDPKESIDFNGNTGPFVQYTYARIKSVLRKANQNQPSAVSPPSVMLHKKEKEVIKLLHAFPLTIQESAHSYNPGHVANYVYELAKEYNQFYHEVPILKSENEQEKHFRLLLSAKTAEVIKTSLKLLGIQVSERM